MNLSSAFANGFSSTAILIIAIGAQNAFVLRQGLRREHVLPVVAVCALSDAILVQAGVWGLGSAVQAHPALLVAARWLGAAFLLAYAGRALLRAWRPAAMQVGAEGAGAVGWQPVVLTAMAFTWLNPHVYLDTVLLLGAIASPYPPSLRMGFAAGASLASLVWFASLGWGARWLAPLFASPHAWRVLDAVVAAMMVALAVGLLLH
ncbi:lysine efflux permease [Acidovorax sp. CF316]|uniref:LysE/ArgO family amino acid transporter n=1 Tax=Acidovorax sp. CF316 TaxID=1144317 RepID=UPI00026BC674|nr:LysE/ArgO family amino acid transporter [Acidovorax sp. CF316]EJE54062.1 lysine efflux permease [Acidovorax sp. CF316]